MIKSFKRYYNSADLRTRLFSELPRPKLIEQKPDASTRFIEARRHLLFHFMHPDPESKFDLETKKARGLLRKARKSKKLFRTAKALVDVFGVPFFHDILRYNCLLGYANRQLVGHIAFQEHGIGENTNWKVFQYFVFPQYRDFGYGLEQAKRLVGHARENQIKNLRVGGGKNHFADKVMDAYTKEQEQLGVEVQDNYWVNVLDN